MRCSYRHKIYTCVSIIIQDALLESNCGQMCKCKLARVWAPRGERLLIFMHHLTPVSRATAQWIVFELTMSSRSNNFKVTIDMVQFPLNKKVELTNKNGCWAAVYCLIWAMGVDPGEGEIAGWLEEAPFELGFKDW